jgi:predicted CopG family antitoxin
MSRTSIPINSETKDRLSDLKRDDETWDEFLLRIISERGDGMTPGSLSDEEADEVMKVVREGRER